MSQVGGRREGHVDKVKVPMTVLTLINALTGEMERWHGRERTEGGGRHDSKDSLLVGRLVNGAGDYAEPGGRQGTYKLQLSLYAAEID